MNGLITNQFKGNKIRQRVDETGEFWWIAKDICEALSIKKPENAYKRVKEKNKKLTPTSEGDRQRRETLEVNEPGVYQLIASSKKAAAVEFMDWVTSEVLPSIRKTGSYSIVKTSSAPANVENDPISVLEAHLSYMKYMKAQAKALNEKVDVATEIAIEATDKINEVMMKKEEDILSSYQMNELDEKMEKKREKLLCQNVHHMITRKAVSEMKKLIKKDNFDIIGTRTYKEIPQKNFPRALKIIEEYKLSPKLIKENEDKAAMH